MPRPLTYAQLPVGALSDEALTSRDLRVLGALSLYDRPRSGRPFTVLRQAIAEIVRMPETRVSECATRLERRGWISRVATGGGRRTGSAYVINWLAGDRTVTEGRTVSGPQTVTAPRTVSGDGPVTEGRTVSPPHDPTVTAPRTVSPETVPADRTVSVPPLESPPLSSTTVLPNSTLSGPSDARERDDGAAPPKPNDTDRAAAEQAARMQRVSDRLIQAGMPMHYLLNTDDRLKVIGWCEHYTEAEVVDAIERALAARRRQGDSRPIGIRYIDAVLRNPRAPSSAAGGPGWMERSDQAGDEFLAGHEQQLGHAAG